MRNPRLPGRAHAEQRAHLTCGIDRATHLPPVLDQEHVHLVAVVGRDERLEEFGDLFGSGAFAHEPQPDRDAMDVRVHREHRHPEGKQQRAVRGLGPDAGKAAEVLIGGPFFELFEELESDFPAVGPDLLEDRLNARRLDATEAAYADVALNFLNRRIGHLVP